MIRAINVSFNINDEDGTVTNVVCKVEGQAKRKTTTKKKNEVLEPYSIITRTENRLELNEKAVAELKATSGDRINVAYEKINNVLKPVVSVSDTVGNKLSKSNTVAFRGSQNEVLSEFGEQFTLEKYKEDLFKLIPVSQETNFENIKAEIIVNDNEEVTEIDELIFEEIEVELDDNTEEDDTTDIDVFKFKI